MYIKSIFRILLIFMLITKCFSQSIENDLKLNQQIDQVVYELKKYIVFNETYIAVAANDLSASVISNQTRRLLSDNLCTPSNESSFYFVQTLINMKIDRSAKVKFFKKCYVEKHTFLYNHLLKESQKLDNIVDRWIEFFCYGKSQSLLEVACVKTTPLILINTLNNVLNRTISYYDIKCNNCSSEFFLNLYALYDNMVKEAIMMYPICCALLEKHSKNERILSGLEDEITSFRQNIRDYQEMHHDQCASLKVW